MKKTLIIIIALLMCACAGAERMLSASGAHALYLDENGCVWAWGSNQKGESNPNSSEQRVLTPVKVFEDATAAACGRQFSACIDKEGTLHFWGDANCESVTDVKQVSACESLCAYVKTDGSAWAVTGGETQQFSEGGTVSSACGSDFVLLLDESGVCTGFYGAETVRMENVSWAGANGQTGMLISEGRLYVFGGSGSEGRLGIDTSEWISEPALNGVTGAVMGVPGVSVSGAITEDGSLYVWGALYSYMTAFDENGDAVSSLADGILIPYGKTPMLLYQGIRGAAIGDAFIAVMLDEGLLVWGSNDQGQCADGCFTACIAEPDEDEDGGEVWTVSLIDNQQRVFPVFLQL